MKRLIDDPEIAGELGSEMRRYATEQAQVDLKRAFASLEESLQLRAAGAACATGGGSSGTTAGATPPVAPTF